MRELKIGTFLNCEIMKELETQLNYTCKKGQRRYSKAWLGIDEVLQQVSGYYRAGEAWSGYGWKSEPGEQANRGGKEAGWN